MPRHQSNGAQPMTPEQMSLPRAFNYTRRNKMRLFCQFIGGSDKLREGKNPEDYFSQVVKDRIDKQVGKAVYARESNLEFERHSHIQSELDRIVPNIEATKRDPKEDLVVMFSEISDNESQISSQAE
jgi:hypothetical protein